MLKNSRGVFFPRRSNFFSRFCINNPASVVPNFFLNHPPTLEAPGKKEAIRYCFFMCMHYAYIANFFPLSLSSAKKSLNEKKWALKICWIVAKERESESLGILFVLYHISYPIFYHILLESWVEKKETWLLLLYIWRNRKKCSKISLSPQKLG